MKSQRVSVVLLSWQSSDETLAAVRSVHGGLAPGDEILVVDNGSDAEVVSKLRFGLAGLGNVSLLELPANVGYGAGMNLGAGSTTGELIVFSNNDLVFSFGFMDRLRESVSTAGDVIHTPGVVSADGQQTLGFGYLPSIRRLIGTALGLHWLWPRRFSLVAGSASECEWVQGVCLIMSRAAFERAGGFSEAAFMYSEDLRLCARVQELGGSVRVVDTQVTHLDDFSADMRWNVCEKEAVKSYEFVRAAVDLDPRRRQRSIALIHCITCLRGFVVRRDQASRGRLSGAWRYLTLSVERGRPATDPGRFDPRRA